MGWLVAVLALFVVVAVAAAVALTLARRRGQLYLARRSEQVERRDERLTRREETLEAKAATLELREANLLDRERAAIAAQAELDDQRIAVRKRLEEIADFTADEARHTLMERVEAEARRDAQVLVRDLENRAREEAERRAREIVTTAIQRVAGDTTGSVTTSIVPLPEEDLKGRVIGRDGRNIRAFEQVTGVNLVIDESPEAVVLSCFDPVRREVARLALTALLQDGRIHPTRIEEEHQRALERVDAEIERSGHDAVGEARVSGLSPDTVRLLGQLRYRTSYGQSVLRHLIETAHLAGFMAAELGTDPELARRCGLLHDLGKALTHKVEGSHALVGAEVAARLGEPPAVCHAIAAHHGEVEPRTLEAVLTQAADAISASRPGARRDTHEQYVTRLKRLEDLCGGYPGVERVHAMQAGRDVRVMVSPDALDDAGARALASELAGRIEAELAYPGQITVTVVRELRASDVAH